MALREDEFGLRLAAKAADRQQAASQEWPAFESRLQELGYTARAIAHAFRTLSGPGSVAEAVAALERASRPSSGPIPLSFHVIETADGAAAVSKGVTITSVACDDSGIRVSYELAHELGPGCARARAEATDDLGNEYRDGGGHLGFVAGEGDRLTPRARGGFSMPVPPLGATALRVRIMPSSSVPHQPMCEIAISLPDPPSSDPWPEQTSA